MNDNQICNHLNTIKEVTIGNGGVCEECVKTNSTWVHLRTCQQCGATLCCDQSPNKHATKHYHASGHPVMASAQPGERWLWCYVDEEMMDY